MVQVSDRIKPRPARCSTPDFAEILLSLSIARSDEVVESPPSSTTTSCSSSPITKSIKVTEPRVLRSRAPASPVDYNIVSSCPKGQKPSTSVFKIATSEKIQKANKREKSCGTSTKAKMDLTNSTPRRNYASPFRVRRTHTNMSEKERLERLRSEELIGAIKPTSVWCLGCKEWVGLDNRRRYYAGLWEKHKKQYHLPGGQQYEVAQGLYQKTGQWVKLFEPKRKKSNCSNTPKDD